MESVKKIVVVSVCSRSIFRTTGCTIRARRIIEILKNQYNIILVTRENGGQKLGNMGELKIITGKSARTKIFKFINLNLKLIPFIFKKKINGVYCVDDWFFFITYYLFFKIFRYSCPIIFEAHGILYETSKRERSQLFSLYGIFEKFVIRHANHIIVVGENVFEIYKEYNKNIDLIPLFVNIDIFKKKENECEVRKKSKMIGIIGPFDSVDGKYILNFIYKNLDKFDNRINIIVIGKCNYRIKNRRVMYTGFLSDQDYINQLSQLDAVLTLKYFDYGPYTKIIEAMSCSLPVFTVPDGVMGIEHAKHGENIFIFKEDELIDKINELIFDNELMKEIGRNARIIVEKHYSKKVNEKRLLYILENLVDREHSK